MASGEGTGDSKAAAAVRESGMGVQEAELCLDLTSCQLHDLSEVEIPPTLEELDLTANRLAAVDPRIGHLPRLRKISFRQNLLDDDLEELKGCVDLGFGFSYNEIPELCGTLPALELCYSMSQRFLDEHQPSSKAEDLAPEPPAVVPPSPVQPIPNWKISCPGDSPDEVKARLKYWAQAVACTVKLCS